MTNSQAVILKSVLHSVTNRMLFNYQRWRNILFRLLSRNLIAFQRVQLITHICNIYSQRSFLLLGFIEYKQYSSFKTTVFPLLFVLPFFVFVAYHIYSGESTLLGRINNLFVCLLVFYEYFWNIQFSHSILESFVKDSTPIYCIQVVIANLLTCTYSSGTKIETTSSKVVSHKTGKLIHSTYLPAVLLFLRFHRKYNPSMKLVKSIWQFGPFTDQLFYMSCD